MGTGVPAGTHQNFKILGTDGYWIPKIHRAESPLSRYKFKESKSQKYKTKNNIYSYFEIVLKTS